MPAPPPTSRNARLIVGALALASFVASLLIASWLFPHLSANNDEAVYVFQAKALRHGSLTLPAAPHADFFRPWMSGPAGDRQVLVFQPVFPATLALADLVFGTMRIVPGLITAGCVLLMFAFARATVRDERIAVLAAAAMALSPLTLVHSGMYLEYLYAVLFELAVLTLVVRARESHAVRRLVLAGLLHGVLFFMRPFDAILLGVVVVAVVLLPRPSSWLAAVRQIATVGLAALPGVLLCFLYNHHVTGQFLRFPLWAIGGDNSLGFGKRSITAGAPVIDFGFRDAWIAIRQNVRAFPHWIVGGVVGVPVAAYGIWQMRRDRVLSTLVVISVLFPLGYLAYWGNVLIVFGRRAIGPHYYLALLIPACLTLAAGLDALARRSRVVLSCALVAMVAGTAIELPDKIDRNHDFTTRSRAEHDTIQDAVAGDAGAIVVLPITNDGPYLLHPRGWLMNEPDLQGRVLYAADRQGANLELFDRFPTRGIWRFQSAEAPDGTMRPDMTQLRREPITASRAVPVAVRNTRGLPVVVLQLGTGAGLRTCVLDRTSTRDRTYDLVLTLDRDAATIACPDSTLRVALTEAAGTLTVGTAIGPNDDTGFSHVDEYRIWFTAAADRTEIVAPAEQWRRDPTPSFRWRVTVDNPAIALSLR